MKQGRKKNREARAVRTGQCNIRVTEDERREIEKWRDDYGYQNTGRYVRAAALQQLEARRRRRRAKTEEFPSGVAAWLYGEISGVCGKIDEVVEGYNRDCADMKTILERLEGEKDNEMQGEYLRESIKQKAIMRELCEKGAALKETAAKALEASGRER